MEPKIANFVASYYNPKRLPKTGKLYRFDYPKEFVTLPEYSMHRGQLVKVLHRLKKESNESGVPMFRVIAPDGWQGDAWADELAEAPCPTK